MKHVCLASAIAVCLAAQCSAWAAPVLIPENVEVGRNLQAAISVRFSERTPMEGVKVTVRSDDPKRLLLSRSPEAKGQESITMEARGGTIMTPDFWVQAAGETGEATYTVSSPGYSSAKGTVKITPSGLAVLGPFRAPSFSTTPRSPGARISIYAARLTDSLEIAEEQHLWRAMDVPVQNSDPGVGKVNPGVIHIPAGASHASFEFRPSALGKATITVAPLPGFSVPATFASVTAWVERPGMAVTQDLILGKDLQEDGLLYLGEPAPPGGLEVRLTSSDPQKLVISTDPESLGSGSVILKVPEGQVTAPYYLQGLGDSGKVSYKAEAPGFRSALAAVTLTQAGVIVALAAYGPPDEAAVVRKSDLHDTRHFYTSISEARQSPVRLALFTGFIEPVSRRMADITLQRLRAGVSITVDVKSSKPAVAQVASPVTIPSGRSSVQTTLTPLAPGEAIISVSQPPGFGKPENATWVPVTVRE